ncbi:unnamed protein product [Brachionus calyciflorus]|uniref:ADF-H domain-containing protein n=1 Tax=Brachionus calyciflorus TaxID=104777 RepID=A0A814QHN0_9BILA|nr:unnamed protein product [Brachionus calyciflorus]
MASSGNIGFSVDLELVKAFHLFNKDRKEVYLTTKYSSDDKKLIVDEKGPLKKKTAKTLAEKNKHWEDLLAKLPDNEIRFIAIQVDYKDSKAKPQNDVLLLIWTPDGVNIMKKMEVDTHKPVVLRCFQGIKDCIVINSKEDWNLSKIVKDKLKGSLD